MVNPLLIFILSLGAGFLLSLIDKINRKLALTVFVGVLAYNTYIMGHWFFQFALHNITDSMIIQTAGFKAPLSINLQLGMIESFVLMFVNLLGLMSSFYLIKKFSAKTVSSMILYLIMIMGINGLVMTRDLFNIFVFLEIVSIATYAVMMIEQNRKSLSAGFKYMIAGGLASSILLIGIIFVYFLTGTLNIDFMLSSNLVFVSKIGILSLFLLAFGILVELKPYPANGWALDVYQATDSGIAAIISAGNSAGILFILYKLLPIMSSTFLWMLAGAGVITFVFSNLGGLKQSNPKRMLGYSSIAQIGLIITIITLMKKFGVDERLSLIISGGIFINHFIAKASLFWISGIVKRDNIKDWSIIQNNVPLLVYFGLFLVSLTGLPPFPGFWAKWEFVHFLADKHLYFIMSLILIGSLFEMLYLFRWFGFAIKGKKGNAYPSASLMQILPISIFSSIMIVISFWIMTIHYNFGFLQFVPIVAFVVFYLLDFLPAKLKAILAILFLAVYGYYIYPSLTPLQILFEIIFIVGSGVQLIGTMNRKGASKGFYGFFTMTVFAMANLVIATSYLEFFLQWELMTVASYFLILRGKNAERPALNYLIFSSAGAYMMLAGFAISPSLLSDGALITKMTSAHIPFISVILLTLGFIIKTGAMGVHIWLPRAHAEAESDVSPLISAILLKAGVFGLLLVAISTIHFGSGAIWFYVLGWLGVFTALAGAILASMQEDAKRLLAYSSMSQLGVILANLALLSHIGWVSALYLSLNHVLFKSALFLAIAGIVYRTKTRNMYEMGGLIKNMPLSYISVLISIIALSGVPPLSGFGSKWLIYSAFIMKGWYFQAGILFFSSAVSFLYLYKLIHTIFLGQLKMEHQNIKEAPAWFLIPQYIFLIVIMIGSTFPKIAVGPLNKIVTQFFNSDLIIEGYKITSPLGYWNGNMIMMATIVIFVIVFVFLYLVIGRIQRVKQFNIVFAAERPDKPETTHYAHNMFAPYKKALGGWGKPRIEEFWDVVTEWTHSLSNLFRSVYSGNGQTYLAHIIAYMIIFYFILGV